MKEIGSLLKQRREELGYSLDEMSNKTRISIAQLRAIEEGNLAFFHEDLSYVRYFVRFYCQALNLDFEPLRDKLSQEINGYTETVSLKAIKQMEESQSNIEKKIGKTTVKIRQEKRKIDYSLLSLLVVIGVMVVALGTVAVLYLPSLFEKKPDTEPTPQPTASITPTPEETENPFEDPTDKVLTTTMQDARNYNITGWTEEEQISIKVHFKNDTWVRVYYNDVVTDNPTSKVYLPNEDMDIRVDAKKDFKITIHFGYLSGNTISINGKDFALDPAVANATNGQKINFILKGE